jgi:hypothetical protein
MDRENVVCAQKELSGLLRRAGVSHVKKDALNAQKMVV